MNISEKLTQVAENELKVYVAGYEKGKAEGGDGALEVWEAILAGGQRTYFDGAFAHTRFSKDTMRLLYDIKPTTANNMFLNSAKKQTDMFSMTEVEKRDGKVFDFSNCTSFSGAFNSGCFDELNVIDLSKATSTYQTFYNGSSQARIKRINRLIFSEDTVISWGMFGYCTELEHVGFEGVISKSGLDMQWSTKLSKDSITSLVSALSPTTSDLTVTLSKEAVESAFPSEPIAIPFGFASTQDGVNVTFTDNGDGTVTLNGTVEYDTYFSYGEQSAVFSAGNYHISLTDAGGITTNVNLYDVDGNIITNIGWGEVERDITIDRDFVIKAQLYVSTYEFDGTVITYPTVRLNEWESLKATKPNWTISLV